MNRKRPANVRSRFKIDSTKFPPSPARPVQDTLNEPYPARPLTPAEIDKQLTPLEYQQQVLMELRERLAGVLVNNMEYLIAAMGGKKYWAAIDKLVDASRIASNPAYRATRTH